MIRDQKNFKSEKIFSYKKNSCPEKSLAPPKKIYVFGSEKILVQKICDQKFFGQKSFWSKKFLVAKVFGQKFFFWSNDFWWKKFLVEKNLGQKKSWSKKIFGP